MTSLAARLSTRLGGGDALRPMFPGFAVSVLVAVTAQFLSDRYGAPAMLLALLLGLALNFLADEGTRTAPGIGFTARTVLRLGVALLGARISVEMLAALGGPAIALVVAGVILTIGFALIASRFVGRSWRFALLTGGSVAICGASAAMAIAAVLPRHEKSERDLVFTVLCVTVLSTVAKSTRASTKARAAQTKAPTPRRTAVISTESTSWTAVITARWFLRRPLRWMIRLSVSSSASALLDDGRPEESAALMANSIRSPLYRLIPGNPNSVSCTRPSLAVRLDNSSYQTGAAMDPLRPIDPRASVVSLEYALTPRPNVLYRE